jgi:hypothetical protein
MPGLSTTTFVAFVPARPDVPRGEVGEGAAVFASADRSPVKDPDCSGASPDAFCCRRRGDVQHDDEVGIRLARGEASYRNSAPGHRPRRQFTKALRRVQAAGHRIAGFHIQPAFPSAVAGVGEIECEAQQCATHPCAAAISGNHNSSYLGGPFEILQAGQNKERGQAMPVRPSHRAVPGWASMAAISGSSCR